MNGSGVRLVVGSVLVASARGAVTRACLAITLLLALLLPSAVGAQTYEVVSCNSAPGGANNAWSLSASGSAGGSIQCPAGNGIKATATAGTAGGGGTAVFEAPFAMAGPGQLPGGTSRWRFTAPGGTTLQSFSGTWRCNKSAGSRGSWTLTSPSGSTGTGTCVASGFTPVSRSLSAGATVFELSAIFSPCHTSDPGCQGHWVEAALAESRVVVRDATLPTSTITGGTVLTGGWRRGIQSVTYDASDNAGVKSVALNVDGANRGTKPYDCDYTRPLPCSNVPGGIQDLDTALLPDGNHTLQVVPTDAAANSSPSSGRTFNSDNNGPDVYIEGALYEDRGAQLPPNYYGLYLDAFDNFSGVTALRVLIDGSLVFERTQACGNGGCDMEDEDFRFDARSQAGTHRVEVQATDAAGSTKFVGWNVTFGGTTRGASGATAAPPAATGFGIGCPDATQQMLAELDSDPPHRVVNGAWTTATGAPAGETTAFFAEGSYRVSRCDVNGALVVSQLVAPIPVPGGATSNLVVAETQPLSGLGEWGTLISDWLPPDDPEFVATWPVHGQGYEAAVIPPTAG